MIGPQIALAQRNVPTVIVWIYDANGKISQKKTYKVGPPTYEDIAGPRTASKPKPRTTTRSGPRPGKGPNGGLLSGSSSCARETARCSRRRWPCAG